MCVRLSLRITEPLRVGRFGLVSMLRLRRREDEFRLVAVLALDSGREADARPRGDCVSARSGELTMARSTA